MRIVFHVSLYCMKQYTVYAFSIQLLLTEINSILNLFMMQLYSNNHSGSRKEANSFTVKKEKRLINTVTEMF